MISILLLGLFIGMQHALEADHVAAVAAIATKQRTKTSIITHGATWGLGHTITLMLCAGVVLFLGLQMSPDITRVLEATVGVMLVMLGANVLYRLYKSRVHFHMHKHADGVMHFHAHAHEKDANAHNPEEHEHTHKNRLPLRTLAVGMMHGLAGSAALLILTTATAPTAMTGIAYVAVFGVGSIVGMAALSAVIAVPLTYSAKFLTWANNGLQLAIGSGTAMLGAFVLYENLLS